MILLQQFKLQNRATQVHETFTEGYRRRIEYLDPKTICFRASNESGGDWVSVYPNYLNALLVEREREN